MNLNIPGKAVDLLHTGMWTTKPLSELKKLATYRLAASSEPDKFMRIPPADQIHLAPDASYVYMATNNTIEGTEWHALPPTGQVPLVADMSSDILSRPLDVTRFGLIFAGAQTNLGPSGVTVVIVRRDLAERASADLPTWLQYRSHIKERSLFHTPPGFAIYVVGLVLEWVDSEGGARAMARRNDAKAKLIYDALDSSTFYSCPVERSSRSKMNVVFRVAGGNEALESTFRKQAAAEGLVGVAGHRSVGGMRVSLYNAVSIEAAEALVGFMQEFERKNG
jgi:phosphoserine aminotransferase